MEDGHSHTALEQNCLFLTVRGITQRFLFLPLSFPPHPDDTSDPSHSLYIPNISKVNCVPLKIDYLPKWPFKVPEV